MILISMQRSFSCLSHSQHIQRRRNHGAISQTSAASYREGRALITTSQGSLSFHFSQSLSLSPKMNNHNNCNNEPFHLALLH